jgi:hypothetical protein
MMHSFKSYISFSVQRQVLQKAIDVARKSVGSDSLRPKHPSGWKILFQSYATIWERLA